MNRNVLIVDDDCRLREMMTGVLQDAGLQVRAVDNVGAVLGVGLETWPDLLVQGVDRPETEMLEAYHFLRETADVPVLFLPRRDHEIGFLLRQGLTNFDYLPKPVGQAELLHRVTLLERSEFAFPALVRHGPVRLQPLANIVHCNDTPMFLCAEELRTLEMMLRQPSRLFSRESIMQVSFGGEINPVIVDGHVAELNQKFRKVGVPELIGVVCGVGFVLNKAY